MMKIYSIIIILCFFNIAFCYTNFSEAGRLDDNCRDDEDYKVGSGCDLTCGDVKKLSSVGKDSDWPRNVGCINIEKPRGCYCKSGTYRYENGNCIDWEGCSA